MAKPIPDRLKDEFIGWMSAAYEDDDAPDGAWFARMEDDARNFMQDYGLRGDENSAVHQLLAWMDPPPDPPPPTEPIEEGAQMQKEHSTEAEGTPESLASDKLRAEFEAWYADHGGPQRMRKAYPGEFVEQVEEAAAWDGYQAASASRAELVEALEFATRAIEHHIGKNQPAARKARALIAKYGS